MNISTSKREQEGVNLNLNARNILGGKRRNYSSQLPTKPCAPVPPRLEENNVMLKWEKKPWSDVNYTVILTVWGRLSIFMDMCNSPKATEPRLSSHKTCSCVSDSELQTLCFCYQQSWSRKCDCVSVRSSKRHCPQICSFIYCRWRNILGDAVLFFSSCFWLWERCVHSHKSGMICQSSFEWMLHSQDVRNIVATTAHKLWFCNNGPK